MRGATVYVRFSRMLSRISIHAPHAGRDVVHALHDLVCIDISIHAPHAGRDPAEDREDRARHISIHAPHAGRDI